jgi:hypothetical protein
VTLTPSLERAYPALRTHSSPRVTKRFSQLYRGRAAVEREFGRLKNEHGLTPLRVRGLERVALHADLTMLARLSLARARPRVQRLLRDVSGVGALRLA